MLQGKDHAAGAAAVKAKATLGEIVSALTEVYGRYRERSLY